MRWYRRGDYAVDTHVLIHHSKTRPQWLDQCLASLESESTSIILVDSDSDHIGQLRAEAMTHGTAPAVSFVDDDDWLEPGALDACAAAIGGRIIGAYTGFRRIDAETDGVLSVDPRGPWSRVGQACQPYTVLHCKAFARSALTPAILAEVAKWPTAEEVVLTGLLAGRGDWLHLPIIGANKREHKIGAGARITPTLLAAAMIKVARDVLSIKQIAATDTGCPACNKMRRIVAGR